MALLSMVGNGEKVATSTTASISPEAVILLMVIILGGATLFILIWLVVELMGSLNEKNKYYRNLNKKFEEEREQKEK